MKKIEGKQKGSSKWVGVDADYFCDIEGFMFNQGFDTKYLGINRHILVVENPKTGEVEWLFRKVENV